MLRYHVAIGGHTLCTSKLRGADTVRLEAVGYHVTCGHGDLREAEALAAALRKLGYAAKAEEYPCPTYFRRSSKKD